MTPQILQGIPSWVKLTFMAPSGTVLLVSSSDGREMYADYLRANALIVSDADTPERALRNLDTVDPHVVVTDFVFRSSSYDGPALLRALRTRVDGATSIIVVSGLARQDDRETARAAGADLYLVKPALPSAVLYEVRRALLLRRSGRRLSWNWRDSASTPARVPVERRQSRAS
jgi:DNA-binding response OmpR family regulator